MTKRNPRTTATAPVSRRVARTLSDHELELAVGGVKTTSGSGAGLPHGNKVEESGGFNAGLPPGWNASPNSHRKQLLSDMI